MPSPLGSAIEATIERDQRFSRYREPVQYLCSYRTPTGQVFAFERTTKTHIRLWLPANEMVRAAAEKIGLSVTKSVPNTDRSSKARYGRLSSLKRIPELRNAVLYAVPVTSSAQALAVLEALH
jgi:hypothetical protein